MVMDEYRVRIGSRMFTVRAEDNLGARYRAAELFKEEFKTKAWLTEIVKHAKAKLITAPEIISTTEDVLTQLKK